MEGAIDSLFRSELRFGSAPRAPHAVRLECRAGIARGKTLSAEQGQGLDRRNLATTRKWSSTDLQAPANQRGSYQRNKPKHRVQCRSLCLALAETQMRCRSTGVDRTKNSMALWQHTALQQSSGPSSRSQWMYNFGHIAPRLRSCRQGTRSIQTRYSLCRRPLPASRGTCRQRPMCRQ